MNIFGGYDIRGIFGKDLTLDIVERIGKAFGTMNDGRVVIGYDVRHSSPKMFNAFTKGVLSTGVDVFDVSTVPNPIAYFSSFKLKTDGAFITASHNPPEFNGIKFFDSRGVSYLERLKELKKIYEGGKFRKGGGKIERVEMFDEYVNNLSKNIKINGSIKFVADCFNASGSLVTPHLFDRLGVECMPINNGIKGDFGGLRP